MSNFYSWIIRMLLGTVAYLKLKSVQTESRDRISLQRGIKNSVSFHPIKHMTCRSATKSRDSVFWILELSSVSSRWFGRSARKSLLQFKAPDLVIVQRNCAASLTRRAGSHFYKAAGLVEVQRNISLPIRSRASSLSSKTLYGRSATKVKPHMFYLRFP